MKPPVLPFFFNKKGKNSPLIKSRKDTVKCENWPTNTYIDTPTNLEGPQNEESQAKTHKECFIELKRARKLPLKLMNTVKPLQKHWATLIQIIRVLPMTTPVSKLVAKIQPLHLHEDLETLRRSTQGRSICACLSKLCPEPKVTNRNPFQQPALSPSGAPTQPHGQMIGHILRTVSQFLRLHSIISRGVVN